jgi:uncharacterized membrane protein
MMGAGRLTIRALIVLAALTWVAAPAAAHKHHHEAKAAQAKQSAAPDQAAAPEIARQHQPSPAVEDHMAGMPGMDDEEEDRSKMGTVARVLDWLGRLHPIIIHFPLAFFPAALFTAIVGRRRPAFAKPVQFLVVAGGIIAPIAAVLGWLDAIDADPGSLLTVHRWLGTAIGLSALALAIWAWKRPEEDRRPGMVWGLAAITAALLIQGWYGGAMVHGIDHMNW